MTPNEIKDYELLKEIQSLCEAAKEWDGPVSFESIYGVCSYEMQRLKTAIGKRIIENQDGMDQR